MEQATVVLTAEVEAAVALPVPDVALAVAPAAVEEANVTDWREETAVPDPWQFAPFSQHAEFPFESVEQYDPIAQSAPASEQQR